MTDVAIRVENLSKQYRIGATQDNKNLREALRDAFKAPFRRAGQLLSRQAPGAAALYETFWALKDISFEIKPGEVVGIIGRNGSGKSTLLKILSRITEPAKGFAEVQGRVSSLLEVGTGFHAELSGRENIYLNGAILGMKKADIRRKFDEIVDFSEIERFIDTPVKHYSSGMYLRLAFAVAANLEPEILLVDEVLAVGDMAFQKKCLGKMGNVSKEGRTILFVSHNMGAITGLCGRALWLERGDLRLDGPSLATVSKYIYSHANQTPIWSRNSTEDNSSRQAWLKNARVISGQYNSISPNFGYNEQIFIEITYEIRNSIKAFRSYVILKDSNGNILWASTDTDGTDKLNEVREPGAYCSTCEFPEGLLPPGQYYISVGITGKPREGVDEEHLDVISFEISEVNYTFNHDRRLGIITPCLTWKITNQDERCL